MTIRAVFRVQCDGPCKGWLSFTEDYVPGTDIAHTDMVTAPTAERACNWPGERAARTAAQAAGWDVIRTAPMTLRCPDCTQNPLDIRLPRVCGHVSPGPLGSLPCIREQGHSEEHVHGTVDWF